MHPSGIARRGRGATGAVGAQLAQALASLVLSIAAARSLGADGLGIFGLISGGLVLATAIATGLVGDPLTVLDRSMLRLRAGLQIVGFSCALVAGIGGGALCWATGLLGWQASVMFGLGSTAFILEEFLRRLLMASLRFWSVMVVDLTCLAATVCWLSFAAVFGALDMFQILLALLVSQIVAMLVAVRLLPHSELELTPWRFGDVTAVLQFGGWRAAQQAVRPAMLTAMRILVVIAAGTVAFGELEAARVYAAPTLLIVNGIGHDDFIVPMLKASGNTHVRVVHLNDETPQLHSLNGTGVCLGYEQIEPTITIFSTLARRACSISSMPMMALS